MPEEVRNAIYNGRRWFDRSKYLPEGSEEDPFMYLDTQIYDALHALTELQREILFRTVINGESTESIAQEKQCSARNIRDIQTRVLRQIVCWGEQLWTAYPWLEPVAAVFGVLLLAVMFPKGFRREAESLLRQHWASLNGSQKNR